ncbi:MAG TPA: kelch repeat-containing protein [Chloroflexota bacterium]|nr:kelch repeat-containing protein [Chloroflexota bacterium]
MPARPVRWWARAVLLLAALALAGCGPAVATSAGTSGPGGHWIPAGTMLHAREFASATKLADGRVLVTGGISANQRIPVAEIFNPTTKTWSEAGALQTPRTGDVPVLLHSGKVMVIGGYDGKKALASTEIFDPATLTWSAGPPLHQARTSFAALTLKDGRVLVVAGYDGTNDLSETELYDPKANAWAVGPSLPAAISGESVWQLANGNVLVAGGQTSSKGVEVFIKSCELFHPGTNTWSSTGDLSQAYVSWALAALPNQRVLLDGEFVASNYSGGLLQKPHVEAYDPGTGSWGPIDQMLTIRLSFSLDTLGNGEVLAAGGLAKSSAFPLRTAELYNPATGHWSPTASMAHARQAAASTTLSDGTVLVAGGVGSNLSSITSAEIFVPSQG